VLENQKPLRSLLRQVKRLNRSLSRKQKGSQNREKARRKLARLHYRITCIRDDILHKATTALAAQYGFIGLENLNVKDDAQSPRSVRRCRPGTLHSAAGNQSGHARRNGAKSRTVLSIEQDVFSLWASQDELSSERTFVCQSRLWPHPGPRLERGH
jgi:putative transposase